MLQSIRDRAQGWIAWFIVILISVPFALWGIQEYLGVGSEPVVAKVNGQEITEREFESRYRDYRSQLRQRLGDAYRPDLFNEQVLRQESLDSMIRNELIRQEAATLGMRAGDDMVRAAIAEIPVFQVNGRFNMDAYERVLRSQGLSEQGFLGRMRDALLTEQLEGAISGTTWVTDAELEEAVRLQRQTRSFEYLTIPASDYAGELEISQEEIEQYYQANTDQFVAPEQVKIAYLELNQDAIAANLEATDESLRAFYEQHRDEYVAPERRRASHILISVDGDGDDEAISQAEDTAKAALARVRGGESFAEVAKELSQDPGSAAKGGDLGFFGRGVMVPAFEEAVFAMEPDQISDPVRSDFGFHIIQLTEVEPESGKSFEEAKPDVEVAYLKGEAQRVYFDYAERLADLAYEEPGSLTPAAEALGMEIQETDWVARENAEGLFRNPKVINAAFSDDVLYQGNNSELIELENEHSLVLRVREHKESSTKPLDAVREEIEGTLTQQKAAEKAKAVGQEYLAELKSGESDLATVAGELEKEVVDQEEQSRGGGASQQISSAVFRLPPPVEGKVSVGNTETLGGDYVLIVLSAVTDGDFSALGDAEKERLRRSVAATRGRTEFEHLAENLRVQGDVIITLGKSEE